MLAKFSLTRTPSASLLRMLIVLAASLLRSLSENTEISRETPS